MTDPFIGEIRMMPWSYAPKGWAYCDGQLLQIAQNQALFSLLGTAYGGDGRTTFGLPDLRGRVPVHADGKLAMGARGGESTHVLTAAEMPTPHNHVVNGTSAAGTSNLPAGNLLANPGLNAYALPVPPQPVGPSISPAPGGGPHENMAPYLAVGFCIALVGVFPSRN